MSEIIEGKEREEEKMEPDDKEEPPDDSELTFSSTEFVDVSHQSCNPSLPSEINPEDIQKIKGDAIGDTLYSERYVLSVLLKLSSYQNELTDEFEKDLCTLWDMTIEKDVVKLLLQHDVLDLFGMVIHTTENVRMIEIIVGIIGNMCCFSEARDIICDKNDIMLTILNLIDNDDAPTLIQLMRFIKSTLIFENSGDEINWFNHFKSIDKFIEKFSFILANSTSSTLLLNCFEALNSIFNKFSVIEIQPEHKKETAFQETFIKSCLISGLIEAFKQTLPDLYNTEMIDVSTSPTEKYQKIMNYFLEINVLLSQYDNLSRKIYQPFLPEVFDCMSRILNPLCYSINLFPISPTTQDIIENINEVFQSLSDPFDQKCFIKFTIIWSEIKKFQDEINDGTGDTESSSTTEWNNINDDINTDDICMTILEYITRVNKNSNQEDLNNSLRIIGRSITERLLNEISVGDSEPDIEKCCAKLRCGLKQIWNV